MPPETFTYRFFARTYRFTEQMTDEASLDAVTWWPLIEQAEADAEKRKMQQESSRQQHAGR